MTLQLKQHMRKIFCFIFLLQILSAQAQNAFEGIESLYEFQTSVSNNKTPLWLNANKYGLSSLEKSNGYARAFIKRDISHDDNKKWGFGYGLDFAVPYNYSTKIALQQLYAEVRYWKIVLSLGSKNQPMELKNNLLSTGSQTLGINARSIPQVRLAIPDYWTVPYTKDWLALKGHGSYGIMTDGNWQEDFAGENERWSKNVLYHSKALYLRFGNTIKHRVDFELGLEMASQFGGTITYFDPAKNYEKVILEGGKDFSSFVHALIPGGKDYNETTYQNAEGNTLGSWIARLNYRHENFEISIYGDHFFEDHSQMFLMAYSGFKGGDNWQERSNKLYLYPLKDGLLGIDLKLKYFNWINNVVLEFINTKDQSGPIYHDHTVNIPDQIGGIDNYYNHTYYSGWQYYGQVIGNPLYLSPHYNEDGNIFVYNNRFTGWHLGFSGQLNSDLEYRVLGTWQKGYGHYVYPYDTPRENVSLLIETEYQLSKLCKGLSVNAAIGVDKGSLLGDNTGAQITLRYKR